MSAKRLWRWSKSEARSQNLLKGGSTISCYLEPGGKETLRASNQSEEESSVSHRARDRILNQNLAKTPRKLFMSLSSSLSSPPLLLLCHKNKNITLWARKACRSLPPRPIIVKMRWLRHEIKDLVNSIQMVLGTAFFFKIPWRLKLKTKTKQNKTKGFLEDRWRNEAINQKFWHLTIKKKSFTGSIEISKAKELFSQSNSYSRPGQTWSQVRYYVLCMHYLH